MTDTQTDGPKTNTNNFGKTFNSVISSVDFDVPFQSVRDFEEKVAFEVFQHRSSFTIDSITNCLKNRKNGKNIKDLQIAVGLEIQNIIENLKILEEKTKISIINQKNKTISINFNNGLQKITHFSHFMFLLTCIELDKYDSVIDHSVELKRIRNKYRKTNKIEIKKSKQNKKKKQFEIDLTLLKGFSHKKEKLAYLFWFLLMKKKQNIFAEEIFQLMKEQRVVSDKQEVWNFLYSFSKDNPNIQKGAKIKKQGIPYFLKKRITFDEFWSTRTNLEKKKNHQTETAQPTKEIKAVHSERKTSKTTDKNKVKFKVTLGANAAKNTQIENLNIDITEDGSWEIEINIKKK